MVISQKDSQMTNESWESVPTEELLFHSGKMNTGKHARGSIIQVEGIMTDSRDRFPFHIIYI